MADLIKQHIGDLARGFRQQPQHRKVTNKQIADAHARWKRGKEPQDDVDAIAFREFGYSPKRFGRKD